MSRHAPETRARAILHLLQGRSDKETAALVSTELDINVGYGSIATWRKQEGIPKFTKTVVKTNGPICKNFNKLVKLIKPVGRKRCPRKSKEL